MYYNYHNQIKKLIRENHLKKALIVENYKKISPCLLLFFDNHIPMPVRKEHFNYYLDIIKTLKNVETNF